MESTSDDEKPRSATEVILSLEQKTDLLFRMLATTDVTTKLMLDRLNKICSLLEGINSKFTPPQQNNLESSDTDEFKIYKEEVVSEPPVVVENSPKGNRRTARPETYPEETIEKVIPVVQAVLDPNGKSVFMAEVEIVNEDTHVVSKGRTTTAGKWQMPLPIGSYKVSILKRATANRKRLEYQGTFTVNSVEKPIQLDPAKLVPNG